MMTKKPHPLEGTVVLLTTANSPVISALAEKLAKLGAHVNVAGSCTPEPEALSANGIKTYPANLSSRAELVQVINDINSNHGPIDLLINGAEISIPGLARNLTPEDWEEVLGTSVMGTVNGIELVYPDMVRRGVGHIVNLGSVFSEIPRTCAAPHAASKAFILGLDRSLGPEASHAGISLTLVLQGLIGLDNLEDINIAGPEKRKALSGFSESDAEKTANVILEGITKKKRRIFCPPVQARVLWHVAHWFPFLLRPLQKKFIKPFASEKP